MQYNHVLDISSETIIGLQIKVTSHSDLTESGNIVVIFEKVCRIYILKQNTPLMSEHFYLFFV